MPQHTLRIPIPWILACPLFLMATRAAAQDETPTKVTDQNRSGDLPFSSTVIINFQACNDIDGPIARILHPRRHRLFSFARTGIKVDNDLRIVVRLEHDIALVHITVHTHSIKMLDYTFNVDQISHGTWWPSFLNPLARVTSYLTKQWPVTWLSRNRQPWYGAILDEDASAEV